MRAQSYLFVESESFFSNGQSRLYFVQFSKGPVRRNISTCKNYSEIWAENEPQLSWNDKILYPLLKLLCRCFYTCGEGCDAFNKYYVWLKEICCLLPSISNKLGMINHFYNIFYLTQNWLSPVSNILSISQLNCGRECVLLKMSSCEP